MRLKIHILCLLFLIASCGDQSELYSSKSTDDAAPKIIVASEDSEVFDDMPQKWRVQCVGGEGTYGVPIYWDFISHNKQTKKVIAYITDADGFRNKMEDYGGDGVHINSDFTQIELDGVSSKISNSGKYFKFDLPFCPGGMEGKRVS